MFREQKLVFQVAVAALLLATSFSPLRATAEEYASKEQAAGALGHYARARALLVEALREFEAGKKLARPDMLVDSEEWRLSVISRTEELNRILDPKPRITRSGVRFQASPILIKREKQQLPAAPQEARSSNIAGEEDRAALRAHLGQMSDRVAPPAQVTPAPLPAPVAPKPTIDETRAKDQLIDEITEEPAVDLSKDSVAKQVLTPPATKSDDIEDLSDDDDVDDFEKAVEQAIREKMEKLESEKNTEAK